MSTAYIVIVSRTGGTTTHYGPFATQEEAERYAGRVLSQTDFGGCSVQVRSLKQP